MKKSPKMLPNTFLSFLMHNLNRENSIPKARAASAIFPNAPKVNNRPRCENSADLVTLERNKLCSSALTETLRLLILDKSTPKHHLSNREKNQVVFY
jgi:hypothetical protein